MIERNERELISTGYLLEGGNLHEETENEVVR